MVVKSDGFSFHKQYVSIIIVVINVLIFTILQLGPNQSTIIIEETAFVPSNLINGISIANVFIAMFIHINYLHLITNMSVFFIVAYKLEKKIGHSLFLILYIGSGICAFLFHTAMNLFNADLIDIRLYGASGAIFGILGFYLILFFNKIYQNINLSHLFIYILIHLIFLTAVMVHFGGFILGIIFGFIYKVAKKDDSTEKPKMYVRWSELGHAYLLNEMFQHALNNLKFAIKLNPLDTVALMDIGYCHTKMGNLNEAIDIYKQVIKIDPKNDLAWSNLARIY
ncbi:MAG: rhomboid family intramembrane serine protease, partial [Promethearchaeota archaeon]